tara:strand:- start:30352 stop:31857 length:1506 start_codon:yes stop_codon:yes gene_type:complete
MIASRIQPAALALHVHGDDDVAMAVSDLPAGAAPGPGLPVLLQAIPAGHKFALHAIRSGDDIRKYGAAIGHATHDIAAGEHVHSHNLITNLAGELSYARDARPAAAGARFPDAEFLGYRRADGRVGTRNEIWVIATVGCVNKTVERIARLAGDKIGDLVDGVHAITHPFGCSQLGDDLERTRALLAALACHPNAGGVVLVGLGCETNQLQPLLAAMPGHDPARIRSFASQTARDEIATGVETVLELAKRVSQDRREPCPVADLMIGMKCGGSDAFSGLTANPLTGRIADRVDAGGGTCLLTEIPEMFGAEQVLLNRAGNAAVFDALGAMVNRFKRYFLDHGESVSGNPSPGNIAGGITTLEEKSLGAVQKAGSTIVRQVLDYGQPAAPRGGLALLEAPGNDAVSTTALVAAGATIILFTTGRGTPLGAPVPTLKISSNSALAVHKPNWIDFDAGCVLEGESYDNAADHLFDLVLETASGKPARNEINQEREIAIWKSGVTL